jgi:hypothetical protein
MRSIDKGNSRASSPESPLLNPTTTSTRPKEIPMLASSRERSTRFGMAPFSRLALVMQR